VLLVLLLLFLLLLLLLLLLVRFCRAALCANPQQRGCGGRLCVERR
jgi:hypothetical protein